MTNKSKEPPLCKDCDHLEDRSPYCDVVSYCGIEAKYFKPKPKKKTFIEFLKGLFI